jgi:hypothetical protein
MKRFWKLGIVAMVVLALGGVAAGIVAAQTSGGTATPTDQSATATPSAGSSSTPAGKQALLDDFLTKLAANLGISVDQLTQAFTTTETQMLDQAVADGKITQDEADKIQSRIDSGDFPIFPFGGHGGPGRGHGGPGHGFGFGLIGDDLVKQTADFLGVDRQTVIDGLQNDQSLTQIAVAHGKTADGLSGYLNDQLKSKLDEAVANNRITQEREDSILSNAQDRIDEAINRTGPFDGPWGGDKPFDSGTVDPTSL